MDLKKMAWIGKKVLRLGGLLAMLCCFGTGIRAQGNPFEPNDQVDFPGDPGFSDVDLSLDTTQSDSNISRKIDIKPRVIFWDREGLFLHKEKQRFLSRSISLQYKYDELDRQEGFIQSLGQAGKPYQIWMDGVQDRYFFKDEWKDPILSRYNDYLIDAENKVDFIDTRTPYVNVQYMQGPDRLQTTDVVVSRNINPFWNATLFIQRQVAESAYRNMITDHFNVFLSTHIHAWDNRYHAFATYTYNQLNDAFNGGTPRDAESPWLANRGDLLADTALYFPAFSIQPNVDFNGNFFKGTNAPLLDDALRRNRVQQVYLDHQYELIPEDDSLRFSNRLTLRNELLWEVGNMNFSDFDINTSGLSSNLIPVYPTLEMGRDTILENWTHRRFKVSGLASYSLQTKGGFEVNVNGGLEYQVLQFLKDTTLTTLNSTDQKVSASISFPLVRLQGMARQRFSDRFAAERDLHLQALIKPWSRIERYRVHPHFAEKDSLGEIPNPDSAARYRPVSVSGGFLLRDMNPSLFQTFFVGDSGNSYLPDPSLGNQLYTHAEAGIRYDFPVPVGLNDSLLPVYVEARGFFSRIDNPIYFDSNFDQVQDRDNGINWLGIEARFRLRFWRKFYLENSLTYQIETEAADELETRLQEQSVPNWYGQASLYYENSKVSFAEHFRFGIDFCYFDSFAGQSIDPLSTEYFATNYEVPSYLRIGLHAVLKLRGVYVWGRVQHVNESLLTFGYYTTPFYPMLERAVTFGVNWNFFD